VSHDLRDLPTPRDPTPATPLLPFLEGTTFEGDPTEVARRGPYDHRDETFEVPRIERYRIEGILGRGGMGVVYRAADLLLAGRPVALKTFTDKSLLVPELRERFRREVCAMASLDHPGIVAIRDAGEVGGLPYLVMDLVQGESLDVQLRRGPLEPRVAAAIVRDVALALAHAHARGILHRDVKPANVLVLADGTVKLVDFGLARALGEQTMTATGDVIGTPGYFSPEQAAGNVHAMSARTDVWGLGALLYRLLAGRAPFVGSSTAEILMKVGTRPPDPIGRDDVGLELEEIVLRCLQKSPDARYRTADDLAADLDRWLASPAATRRPRRIPRAPP
jgi:serine/threonine protein kinase